MYEKLILLEPLYLSSINYTCLYQLRADTVLISSLTTQYPLFILTVEVSLHANRSKSIFHVYVHRVSISKTSVVHVMHNICSTRNESF
jgi:hypothetical protein